MNEPFINYKLATSNDNTPASEYSFKEASLVNNEGVMVTLNPASFRVVNSISALTGLFKSIVENFTPSFITVN